MPLPILPNSFVQTVERNPMVADAVVTSPFDGSQEVQFWGGEWWEYRIVFGEMQEIDGSALSAFFAALRGRTGAFLFRDPLAANPLATDLPVVNGADQVGDSLITSGWSASQTVLRAGQFFQLGSDTTTRFHQVIEDVVSDGSGNATVSFFPSLRESPADAAPVTIDEPAVRLRLTQPVPTRTEPGIFYRFSITAREVL